jgi:hypothetical protein
MVPSLFGEKKKPKRMFRFRDILRKKSDFFILGGVICITGVGGWMLIKFRIGTACVLGGRRRSSSSSSPVQRAIQSPDVHQANLARRKLQQSRRNRFQKLNSQETTNKKNPELIAPVLLFFGSLQLHALSSGRKPQVVTAMTMLKQYLYR